MQINVPESSLPRVVIVGGGFGGMELAKRLSGKEFQVVLIDKNNFHTFQPLLYQVATAGLEPDSIAFPIRKTLKGKTNFYFRMACAEKVIPSQNILKTSIGEVKYDYLVLATGSDTNYFGNKKIESLSMPMKSIVEALDLRSILLQNLEEALLMTDLQERERLLNIVIVGGGPTGVEMAGALAELKNHILPKDYPELQIKQMQIHLIEAGPRVLAPFDPKGSAKTEMFLKDLGVHVWTNTQVLDYDGNLITTQTHKTINSKTVIWAAGVSGKTIPGLNAEAVVKSRYAVNEFNMVKGYTNIFAIGDVAGMYNDQNPKGHPMVAPVAIQQAEFLSRNLYRLKQSKAAEKFVYKDKGSMATIGRNKAIAEIGNFKTQGFVAWVLWMFVHLFMLIGFRNKVVVMINWLWNYISYERGIRLIIRPFKRKADREEPNTYLRAS